MQVLVHQLDLPSGSSTIYLIQFQKFPGYSREGDFQEIGNLCTGTDDAGMFSSSQRKQCCTSTRVSPAKFCSDLCLQSRNLSAAA